jgi:uncharacterized protein
MALFKIYALRADGQKVSLHYDNQSSSLTWEDGTPVVQAKPGVVGVESAVSVDLPGRNGGIRVLIVSLGLSCNYECSYCSQRFVPHAESSNPDDIEPFVAQLTDALIEPPECIEFWGGEPLVYWKTLKPLAERLRQLYPQASFLIITNGSLLDAEKNEWLDRMGFGVGLSHDGPGYHARGADPLDDPEKRAAIMDLYARLHPQGRISVNAMLHADNRSRAHVQTWLQERFGQDVRIGEGSFIDPYDDGGLASTFQTPGDHIGFRATAYKELRLGTVASFSIGQQKIMDFVQSIRTARPASALGQKCGMDKADNIAVDLHGNVLTCQNVSAAAVAPNGQSHGIGHLSNLQAVKMRTATHWSKRKDELQCCNCARAVRFWRASSGRWLRRCYSDNVPFLAAAIEYLTGCIPLHRRRLPRGPQGHLRTSAWRA